MIMEGQVLQELTVARQSLGGWGAPMGGDSKIVFGFIPLSTC